jgi:predicted dehydrogenase
MKALVIGYGSIGQRHTRILGSLGFHTAVVSSQKTIDQVAFSSVVDAMESWAPDHIVIASPTSQHHRDLAAIARTGFAGTCLVEKPLFQFSQPLPTELSCRIAVGYNLRFLDVIQRLRELLSGENIISASVYNGEYLPDWRPGRNYRTTSSARTAMGGGVLRDLSHEIDLVHYFLGAPTRVTAEVSRSGLLEIDTEDSVRSIFHHENGCTTTVALSYLDQVRRREMLFVTATKSIHCDLLSGLLTINHQTESHPINRDKTFELLHADVQLKQPTVACSASEGAEVVRTIEMIEESSSQKVWVSR